MPKQYVKLAGSTIPEHTIGAFENHLSIDEIIIVGATRWKSSPAAIGAIDENADYILLHDAVRPLISLETIIECIDAVKIHDAVDVVIPCADTIVEKMVRLFQIFQTAQHFGVD